MLVVLLGLLSLSPLALDVALPRPSELSAVAGDPIELERLAARLGGSRLLSLWADSATRGQSRPATVLLRGLGLMSLQHPERACQLLPIFLDTVLPLVRSQRLDEGMTRTVAETLLRIGEGIGLAPWEGDFGGPPQGMDLTPEVTDAARRLVAITLDRSGSLPLPLREAALGALAALPVAAWALFSGLLSTLAQEREQPGLQRAAMSALAVLSQHDRSPALAEIALHSDDPSVAAQAAGELCLVASPPARRATTPTSTALSPALATRVRSLAALDFSPPHRQRLGECLRLLGTPQDRALWQNIQAAAKRPRR